jgi:hypothetical protein
MVGFSSSRTPEVPFLPNRKEIAPHCYLLQTRPRIVRSPKEEELLRYKRHGLVKCWKNNEYFEKKKFT